VQVKQPFPWWVGWSLVPFGWMAWVGFLQGGRRLRRRAWYTLAAAYLVLVVIEFAVVSIDQDDKGLDHSLAGALLIIGYLVGIGHSFALARQIVSVRERIDGFSSLEDLGMTMDLPGDLVEDLRGRVVFLGGRE
jgi:predicted MFS family arabinose efflux permease